MNAPNRRPRGTQARIDAAALAHNLRAVQTAAPRSRVIAVVKADAYGHGAVRCAKALDAAGADALGVALVEEGAALREAGLSGRMLAFGGRYDEVVRLRLEPFVFRLEHLDGLDAAARAAGEVLPVHLKVDTGMGRIGVQPEEVAGFLDALAARPALRLAGLCSHFANADLADAALTRAQVARLLGVAALARARGHAPEVHLANSAAIFSLPEAHLDAVRPGLALYGASPAPHLTADLRPVLTWATEVTHLKTVPVGTPISYGSRWRAARPSVIATLPIGYADGYPRAYTNNAFVLVRGRRAPIVGTVCMDMCMADVTDVPGADVGDEVVLLGAQGLARVTVEELAQRAGTISYEVFCRIGARVPRVDG